MRRSHAADIGDERVDIELPGFLSIDDPLGVVAWLTSAENSTWPALMLALGKGGFVSDGLQMSLLIRDHRLLSPLPWKRTLRFSVPPLLRGLS
jgi:hypothetical protein